MSRQRERIRQAVEERGWTVRDIAWEPIGAGPEKSGPSGGWFVTCVASDGRIEMVLGYNVEEAVGWARWLPLIVSENGS